MGFEPTTTCLGSKDSTTELRPLAEWNPTLAQEPSQSSMVNRAEETAAALVSAFYHCLLTADHKTSLRLELNQCEFPSTDLQTIGAASHRRQQGIRIALLLFIDL